MATAPTLLSIDQYLLNSYHPDADFVDGEIEERNFGEYEHGKIQGLLFHIFTLHQKEWGTDPVVEQRIRVQGNRVRVCDVAIRAKDAPREKVLETAPLICIEVLSPEDRLYRAKEVLSDYLAMGVPNIWLIDPIRRAAFIFDSAGLHEVDPTQLKVSGTPIHVDLTGAFAAID